MKAVSEEKLVGSIMAWRMLMPKKSFMVVICFSLMFSIFSIAPSRASDKAVNLMIAALPPLPSKQSKIIVPGAWVGAYVTYDFYQKFQPNEFDNVKVLAVHGNGPNLGIGKKPAAKLEDLKGLMIRAPGTPGDIVNALGGGPA